MTARDGEIGELREIVRKLQPSGPDGFEGLLAAVLTEILKVIFVLAKSGSQRGRDRDSPLSDQAIKFEAKLYNDSVPREQVLSKLAEIAADDRGQTDLWILGSTGSARSQARDRRLLLACPCTYSRNARLIRVRELESRRARHFGIRVIHGSQSGCR
jgi:hypothetical protein